MGLEKQGYNRSEQVSELMNSRSDFEFQWDRKVAIIWRKKGSELTDKCPFCKKKHIHGSADGHRIVHCTMRNDQSYDFVLKDGDVVNSGRGYIIREYES